ncbi:hypothetical protein [Halomicrococcus sp. NG-SE-24]|uniref:hypothetical protein n=1 Tax=Halomicrococcus sp. NG-SE-24 TaxID=3436928 RepID=UPI003D975775
MTYYCTVYDVIVAADRRGEGFGGTLLNAVLDHPELQSVQGLSLLCRRGLVPFYRLSRASALGRDPEGDARQQV